MNINTRDLTGAALDWAVAKCEGRENDGEWDENFSSNWLLGGPIIERERINLRVAEGLTWWRAESDPDPSEFWATVGPTPLIAAMRCFVLSRLGDTVEVPDTFA